MVKKFYSRKLTRFIFLRFFVVIFFIFSSANSVFASATQGTIDGTYKYAWGENIGWLNFGCDRCNVSVTDAGLSGHAWSRQYGWINLSPPTSGVLNNAEGALSGYAWNSNLGWINFNGVAIDSSGDFSGYATIKSNGSRINFNCSTNGSCSNTNFKVKTDWRSYSNRSSGGSPAPPSLPVSAPGSGSPPPIISEPIVSVPSAPVTDKISSAISSAYDSFINLFKSQEKPASPVAETPKVAPLSLKSQWNLLPVKAIKSFVFAPLPYEIRAIASKFSDISNTLKSVGVEKFSDIGKLTNVTLSIPGLSNINQTIINPDIGTGNIALIKGIPLSKFPLIAKKNLPVEFVFARTGGELVDLDVALSFGDSGQVTQKISFLPGEKMRLVVKPISKPKSVAGYFVFKSAAPKISKTNTPTQISRSSLVASALFSMDGLVENIPSQIPVENKLVLSSFEYVDPDNDGIYTADVISPVTPGEYEIITIIDYIDPALGVRRMSMITVIDPEGYVFEKNYKNNTVREIRIPGAIVSLYHLNTSLKKYELWLAKDYSQKNPQITDIRGTYSFLVPEGYYYFQVEAPGYKSYEGKVFIVTEGSGIHENIELRSSRGWFFMPDWETILLIVVLLLLVYNLSKDKLSKFFKRT